MFDTEGDLLKTRKTSLSLIGGVDGRGIQRCLVGAVTVIASGVGTDYVVKLVGLIFAKVRESNQTLEIDAVVIGVALLDSGPDRPVSVKELLSRLVLVPQ